MLDQAFEALQTYDWGADPAVLKPIGEAVVASYGDAAARGALEERLVVVLKSSAPRPAKEYACRCLAIIGTASSVAALAELLKDADHNHMARIALERIPDSQAGDALRGALTQLEPLQQIGVCGSLGVRQEEQSVAELAKLVFAADAGVAAAAASALGNIRSLGAAQALSQAKPQSDEAKLAVTDASLSCAEKLLADGNKIEALKIYRGFTGENQPKHVRLAATRGMLACAGQTGS